MRRAMLGDQLAAKAVKNGWAGIVINGNWRWSAALRLLGAIWHVMTMALFVSGGIGAKHGDVIMIWGASILAVHLFFVAWNAGDLWRAVWQWRKS